MNAPRQIKIENLSPGCWRLNTEVVPPNGLRVLCCCQHDDRMWFDAFLNGQWLSGNNANNLVFAWQLPAKPMIF